MRNTFSTNRRFNSPRPCIGIMAWYAIFVCIVPSILAQAPSIEPHWWRESGAVSAEHNNPSAAAAVGQAMFMAQKGRQSLLSIYGAKYAHGQYGVGEAIDKVFREYELALSRDTRRTLNNRALKIGQLKYLSAPFWRRLQQFGAPGIPAAPASPYPWPASEDLPPGIPPKPDAIATIGQVKQAFSFLLPLTSDGGDYKNKFFSKGEADSSYAFIHEEFAPRDEDNNGVEDTASAGLLGAFAQWQWNGSAVTRQDLRELSAEYGTVSYFDPTTQQEITLAPTGSFLRLPPARNLTSEEGNPLPLASLELSIPMPGFTPEPTVPEYPEWSMQTRFIYIQYRWRAIPDAAETAGRIIRSEDAHKIPGVMVIGGGTEFGLVGWQRVPALVRSGEAYVGAFDLAAPLSVWKSLNPLESYLLVEGNSDAVFNLRSKADLGAGFSSNGVDGPGWRTVSIRIDTYKPTRTQLTNNEDTDNDEDADGMDIWLDGRPMGRNYGQNVAKTGLPKFKSKHYPRPSLGAGVTLKWLGLRNSPFDIGSIYIGYKNPLFEDEDHDAIPVSGSKPSYTLPLGHWLFPWVSLGGNGGRINHFEETSNDEFDRYHTLLESELNGANNAIKVPGRHWSEPTGFIPQVYRKIDISRFLQSLVLPEQTLPNPFTGFKAGRTRSNAGLFEPMFPGSQWESMIDADQDQLPDNWERNYWSGIDTQDGQSDPDGDVLSNRVELLLGLNPSLATPADGNDVDNDGLPDSWEIKNGYNPFDGVNQSQLDPDRDGLTNAQEYDMGTDPLVANNTHPITGVPMGPRTGMPPAPQIPIISGANHPVSPPTQGAGLASWKSPNNPDAPSDLDGDLVPDDLDAVPYDPNLAFARVPEVNYIVVPLSGEGGMLENGVPIAINNNGHILLAPHAPEGGWAAFPMSRNSNESRAPRLWRKFGESALRVPLPAPSGSYTALWDHAGFANDITLGLDLAEDSDTVLAHAHWDSPEVLPSTVVLPERVPNVKGRRAFIWDGTATNGQWLPWEPPARIRDTEVERILPAGASDGYSSTARQLLSDNRAVGWLLTNRQVLDQSSVKKTIDEWFDFFSWKGLTTIPELDFENGVKGSRSYTSAGGVEPEIWRLHLHDHPGWSARALSWRGSAIITDITPGAKPYRGSESGESSAWPGRELAAANRRVPEEKAAIAAPQYFTSNIIANQVMGVHSLRTRVRGVATALNDFPEFTSPDDLPSEDGFLRKAPFTTGPLIIGPPGIYWARAASTASTTGSVPFDFTSGWLYSHSGYESPGFSAGEKVPFELNEHAKVNNQGVIICEDRLWRNGRGNNIIDLISNKSDYSDFELRDINDSGMIAATAISISRNDRVPVMLMPFVLSNSPSSESDEIVVSADDAVIDIDSAVWSEVEELVGGKINWEIISGSSIGGLLSKSHEYFNWEEQDVYTTLTTTNRAGDVFKVRSKLGEIGIGEPESAYSVAHVIPAHQEVSSPNIVVGPGAITQMAHEITAQTGPGEPMVMAPDGTSTRDLTVTLKDQFGNLAAAGTKVEWRVAVGDGKVEPATSITDSFGKVTARITAGRIAGEQMSIEAFTPDAVESGWWMFDHSLPAFSLNAQNVFAEGQNRAFNVVAEVVAADGTPIIWQTTRGSITGASIIQNGQATIKVTVPPSQQGGNVVVTAYVGKLPAITKKFVASDSPSASPSGVALYVHAPGFAGQTVRLDFTRTRSEVFSYHPINPVGNSISVPDDITLNSNASAIGIFAFPLGFSLDQDGLQFKICNPATGEAIPKAKAFFVSVYNDGPGGVVSDPFASLSASAALVAQMSADLRANAEYSNRLNKEPTVEEAAELTRAAIEDAEAVVDQNDMEFASDLIMPANGGALKTQATAAFKLVELAATMNSIVAKANELTTKLNSISVQDSTGQDVATLMIADTVTVGFSMPDPESAIGQWLDRQVDSVVAVLKNEAGEFVDSAVVAVVKCLKSREAWEDLRYVASKLPGNTVDKVMPLLHDAEQIANELTPEAVLELIHALARYVDQFTHDPEATALATLETAEPWLKLKLNNWAADGVAPKPASAALGGYVAGMARDGTILASTAAGAVSDGGRTVARLVGKSLSTVISAMLGSSEAQQELLELAPFDSWMPLKDEIRELWHSHDYFGSGNKAWELSMDVVGDITLFLPVAKGVTGLVKLSRQSIGGTLTKTSPTKIARLTKRSEDGTFSQVDPVPSRINNNYSERTQGPRSFCFPSGTLVLMADGGYMPIQEIKEGDAVLADDPLDNLPPSSQSVSAIVRGTAKMLTTIEVDSNADGKPDALFASTPNHPFWTEENGWVDAGLLVEGDVLHSASGSRPRVLNASETILPEYPTWNLEVNGRHSFFVVESGLDVLVHNTNAGPRGYIAYEVTIKEQNVESVRIKGARTIMHDKLEDVKRWMGGDEFKYAGKASKGIEKGMELDDIDILEYRYSRSGGFFAKWVDLPGYGPPLLQIKVKVDLTTGMNHRILRREDFDGLFKPDDPLIFGKRYSQADMKIRAAEMEIDRVWRADGLSTNVYRPSNGHPLQIPYLNSLADEWNCKPNQIH